MQTRMLLAVIGCLAVLAIAGCPRSDNTDANGGTTPPKTSQPPTKTPATPPLSAPPSSGNGAPGTTPPGTTPPTTPPGTTPPTTTPPGMSPPATTPPATTPPATTPPAKSGNPVVVLETTKGDIELTLHPDWAPLGAAHYLELVNAKFYDGAPWFRVLDGFVAQCGVAADPKMNDQWEHKTIPDEPVKQGNKAGMVCFGKSQAPNSRSTHIFINLADNTNSLDPQGFACFAEVTKGMDVVLKLAKVEERDQQGLSGPGGLEAFRKKFPEADYIKKAYVKK